LGCLRIVRQRISDEDEKLQLSCSELLMYTFKSVIRLSGVELLRFIHRNRGLHWLVFDV
jgi:hypothetical protein